MIKLIVELQDWELGGEDKKVTIPSNLSSELDKQSEYIIVDSVPSIDGIQNLNIWDLNKAIKEINDENPDMTAELLSIILDAVDGDLGNEEVVRRIKENDFMLEDLSEILWMMSNEEVAARYIATDLGVQFDAGITKEDLRVLGKKSVSKYVDWDKIWDQYERIGFRLAEDLESEEYSLYLIHWREI